MGKCFSCFSPSQNREVPINKPTYDEDMGVVSESVPQTTDTCARSEKSRMFYPRIPTLSRGSSSGESKRSSTHLSEDKIRQLFESYKDPHDDSMLSEGIERFCMDLDVKPEEFKVLVLAWKFGAKQMCRFTREEFMTGCKAIKVDSLKGIQCRLPDLIQEVRDPEKFKDLYRFTFKFGLDVEAGQRSLPIEMAVSLWSLVFCRREPTVLKRWIRFLEKHPHIRGIPRDTWNMFLNFTEVVGDDLSNYDDTEAWPSILDDFVEYENDEANQNVQIVKDVSESDGSNTT